MTERINILVLSSKGHRKHVETLKGRSAGHLRPGQRVRIEGEKEIFTVLSIDTRRHLADLLRDGPARSIETGIPVSLLRVLSEPGEMGDLRIPA